MAVVNPYLQVDGLLKRIGDTEGKGYKENIRPHNCPR